MSPWTLKTYIFRNILTLNRLINCCKNNQFWSQLCIWQVDWDSNCADEFLDRLNYLCDSWFQPQTSTTTPTFSLLSKCQLLHTASFDDYTPPSLSFCLTLTWLFSLGLLCSLHFTKLLCSPLSVSLCPSARWHSILSTASIIWPRAAKHTNCCAHSTK